MHTPIRVACNTRSSERGFQVIYPFGICGPPLNRSCQSPNGYGSVNSDSLTFKDTISSCQQHLCTHLKVCLPLRWQQASPLSPRQDDRTDALHGAPGRPQFVQDGLGTEAVAII